MLDFQRIAAECLANADRLLPEWLPNGKKIGGHYVCGGVDQSEGSSLKISLSEGCWKDYGADPRKGGDLISLYAAIHGIDNGEAAKRLQEGLRIDPAKPAPVRPKPAPAPSTIGKPPHDAPDPELPGAALRWCYRDADGLPLHWVARYNNADGSKDIKPWCWDTAQGRWVCKGWPGERPLYGLEDLHERPGAPVMIVEGEKCADAMRAVDGCVYVVVTWSGGAKAVGKTDWTPLAGRKLIIWPDADQAGRDAAADIVKALRELCPEIKVLDTDGQPDGWDCADAIASGWDWARIVEWAKPRAKVVHPSPPAEVTPPAPEQPQPTAPAAEPEPEDRPEDHIGKAQHDEEGQRAAYGTWDALGLKVGKNGAYQNVENVVKILRGYEPLRGRIWYDEFYSSVMTNWNGPLREWQDVDDSRLQYYMQTNLGLSTVSCEAIRAGLDVVAYEQVRNEPRDFMAALTWDKVDRIEMFFIDCLGAPDTPYTRAVSKNFWISMAARTFIPAIKVDHMVILEGKQGLRKSSALRAIGGKWFAEVASEMGSKQFREDIQGRLLVEIAELDSFGKAAATAIKQVLTDTDDKFRPAYGRRSKKHPRRCIFAGTTNDSSYLRDPTGGRRFWPIACTEIDLAAINGMREQCFAEATARFKAGEGWWETPEEETQRQQEMRRQDDTWEEDVRRWMGEHGDTKPTSARILAGCLGIEIGRQDKAHQNRLAGVMRSLGYEVAFMWVDGKSQRYWRKRETISPGG